MTTPHKITPDWAGQTVAVLASGPSMSQAVADALASHRRIVVNYTFLLAPGADMLVALDLDRQLWADAAGFAGLRVCGVPSDEVDALFVGHLYERIEMEPGHVIETRNSGLAAIRIAAAMGAKRIILAGFDPEQGGHFEGRPHLDGVPEGEYVGLVAGLAAITAELAAQGIPVERYAPVALRKRKAT